MKRRWGVLRDDRKKKFWPPLDSNDIESVDAARRVIWLFAVRLHYARKGWYFSRLLMKAETEIWGPNFFKVIYYIIRPQEQDTPCGREHQEVFEHAKEYLQGKGFDQR
eukprot:TRINITY_DN4629_c0_g1_i1.p1 TRINITY_DN4629_c0_g1~~TRINITY_DN4629_c0_g1_i1.p1  ORF type:complete len:108 (+),score=12.08 TRINITY_DN4629_c0_g1_i1:315-638(+)